MFTLVRIFALAWPRSSRLLSLHGIRQDIKYMNEFKLTHYQSPAMKTQPV
jgi:hypothetical protein